MRERTIMIFPKFNNMEIIDSIRKKYDPLADLVRPHITLVFPFHSDITDAELGSHIENAISGISPFSLHPAGIFKQEDAFGNYLFLDVKEGKKELIRLHDRLYSGVLSSFSAEIPYSPHMTLGKLESRASLNTAYEAVKNISESFCTVADTISVEEIGEQGESILLMEKKLKQLY